MAVDSLDPGAASAPVWAGKMEAYGSNHTVIDQVLPEMLHLIDPHWLVRNIYSFQIAKVSEVSVEVDYMNIFVSHN